MGEEEKDAELRRLTTTAQSEVRNSVQRLAVVVNVNAGLHVPRHRRMIGDIEAPVDGQAGRYSR